MPSVEKRSVAARAIATEGSSHRRLASWSNIASGTSAPTQAREWELAHLLCLQREPSSAADNDKDKTNPCNSRESQTNNGGNPSNLVGDPKCRLGDKSEKEDDARR
jgi:hypothetical protein